MSLPAADRAVVEPRKLRDYLLSPSHPVGRFKASFFARLGYRQSDWGMLSADLRRHAIEGEIRATEPTDFGQKYEVTGTLVGPGGMETEIVTVWIILSEEDFPRFVTAFPGGRP